MRRGRRISAAVLTGMLLINMLLIHVGTSATAAEADDSDAAGGELTEEDKLQRELDEVYAMPVQSNEIEGWPQGPGTYGEAAIVMDVGSGAILYAKNIDAHHYPASITKVLTALLAFENGNLTDTVSFSHDSVAFLKSGDSSVGLKEGNQITLEQALYATLLASANEAAYAVGESIGINAGYDYDWFIEQMNIRCQELGGRNSNFVNTNGLHDPEHYTCARDMALIGCEMFKYPDFFEIVQTLEYVIEESETTERHVFQQKDKMLMPWNSNYYEYVIGGKTGYTTDALATLITMADNDDMQLVCVVLRTYGTNIYPDTRNLLEYAFTNFRRVLVAEYETSEDVEEILCEAGPGSSYVSADAGNSGAVLEEQDGEEVLVVDNKSGESKDTSATYDNSSTGEVDTREMDGYVILPEGVEFDDLDMELLPDGGTSKEATLQYYYKENLVGTVRAVLSESYLEAHSMLGESAADTDNSGLKGSGQDDSGSSENGLWKWFVGLLDDKTKTEKAVICGFGILLVVLVVALVRVALKRKRKGKRRRRCS